MLHVQRRSCAKIDLLESTNGIFPCSFSYCSSQSSSIFAGELVLKGIDEEFLVFFLYHIIIIYFLFIYIRAPPLFLIAGIIDRIGESAH